MALDESNIPSIDKIRLKLAQDVEDWLEKGNKITVFKQGESGSPMSSDFNNKKIKVNTVPPLRIKKLRLITPSTLYKRFNKHAKEVAILNKQTSFIGTCQYHGFVKFNITLKLTHCDSCRKRLKPTLKKWKVEKV